MTTMAAGRYGIRAQEFSAWALPSVFRRLRLIRTAREQKKPVFHASKDAYLLVLLADQELKAGRSDQAGCLVEAAYAAFDEATTSC
jgi:hypothetical protein